jgi:hypothetical protein
MTFLLLNWHGSSGREIRRPPIGMYIGGRFVAARRRFRRQISPRAS